MGKNYLKNCLKYFLPLTGFILGLFIFLLPSKAEAFCNVTILGPFSQSGSCSIYFTGPLDPVSEPYIGIYSDNYGQYDEGLIADSNQLNFCADSNGWTAKTNGIPAGFPSRQFCTVIHNEHNFPGCDHCVAPGYYDDDADECVQCNWFNRTETRILGTPSQLYDPCSDPPGIAGDGDCELACSASPECDEENYGLNVSVSGGECDNCVFVPSEPDLRITNIWPDGSTVRYTINNQGNALAGASDSYLSVDGSYETLDSVSSLSAGASRNESFSYDWIANCTGLTDTIEVCADGGGDVSESNEGNNCRQETWDCPLPNLQIYDIEDLVINGGVDYTIRNAGDASTGSGFYCSLYVDGSYEEYEYTSSALGAGLYRDDSFSWDCTPGQTYSIEVCADDRNGTTQITESNENDNCRTEDLTCPVECTGEINVYPEPGTAPCDFTIDIYNVDYCQGLTWQVTRDGSYVDSDTVGGDINWNTTTYDNDVGIDTSIYYRLYIDGDQKASDPVDCLEEDCTCTAWVNQSCGYSTCDNYHMGRTRTCTPSACLPELDCSLCDESCCTTWVDQDCGLGGCAGTEMYQTRDCGTCAYPETRCVSDPACGAVGISEPIVITNQATNVTETSATLNAILDDMGGAASCLVWFEWGTSGTAGVSGSYGNSTTPTSMSTEGPFTAFLSGLTPGTIYYFEAFAKNGGSW